MRANWLYFVTATWSMTLIFIGVVIYGFIKWRKLPIWLKGGLIEITSYWFSFFVLYVSVLLLDVDPNAMYIMSAPFYYLFKLLHFSDFIYAVIGTFVGSPLVFGFVGILTGLSINRFRKRSAGEANRPDQETGSSTVR